MLIKFVLEFVLTDTAKLTFRTPLGPADQGSNYIPYLDGLRAFSVLIVMVSHFGYSHKIDGGIGVTIFFVISGFIISRVLFLQCGMDASRIEVIKFYARRLFRLVPALMVYLIVMIIFDMIMGNSIYWPQYISSAIYQINYADHLFDLNEDRYFGHLWSLAVEEHFYILFPWILILFGFGRQFLWITCGLTIFIILWRTGLLMFAQDSTLPIFSANDVYGRSDTRFETIFFGVGLSLLTLHKFGTVQNKFNKHGMKQIAVGIAFVLIPTLFETGGAMRLGLGLALQGIGIAIAMNGLIFSESTGLFRQILSNVMIVWLGKISYSFYIWHVAVFWRIVSPMEIENDLHRFVLGVVLATAVSSLSYYGVEKPIREWGRRQTDRWISQRALRKEVYSD